MLSAGVSQRVIRHSLFLQGESLRCQTSLLLMTLFLFHIAPPEVAAIAAAFKLHWIIPASYFEHWYLWERRHTSWMCFNLSEFVHQCFSPIQLCPFRTQLINPSIGKNRTCNLKKKTDLLNCSHLIFSASVFTCLAIALGFYRLWQK